VSLRLSPKWIVDLVEKDRESNAEPMGHMGCPLCGQGMLYYYFEKNGPLGDVLHVHCNREDCLPLSSFALKEVKNGK